MHREQRRGNRPILCVKKYMYIYLSYLETTKKEGLVGQTIEETHRPRTGRTQTRCYPRDRSAFSPLFHFETGRPGPNEWIRGDIAIYFLLKTKYTLAVA